MSGYQAANGVHAREPFAARLRRLREAAGLTQRQLAGEALHPSYVKQNGQGVCLRCHIEDDCTNCHVKHVHPGGATLPPSTGGLK